MGEVSTIGLDIAKSVFQATRHSPTASFVEPLAIRYHCRESGNRKRKTAPSPILFSAQISPS